MIGSKLAVFVVLAGCVAADDAADDVAGDDTTFATVEQGITAPSTLGRYCSESHPGSGPNNWALAWYNNQTGDPCGYIDRVAPGGTVAYRGLFSISGWNTVITRCTGATGRTHGYGATPITAAFNWAQGRSSCVFAISPRELPVFAQPWISTGLSPRYVSHTNGFDFAGPGGYSGGYTINTLALGTGTSTAAATVDHLGQVPSGVDGHDGHDWPISKYTPIRSVADGRVVMVRSVTVPAANCPFAMSDPNQNEVFIEHVIGSGAYVERFVTYYAHLDSFASGLVTGATVTKGQVIGYAGTTGCSSTSHLHLGVYRLTNTQNTTSGSALYYDLPDNPTQADIELLKRASIDPYGWSVTCGNHADCVDPWSHRAIGLGSGAASINLWTSPPINTW